MVLSINFPSVNSAPDLKRIQSVKDKVKEYTVKKSLIKQALSNVDSKPKNRIVFDEEGDDVVSELYKNVVSEDSKKSLFDGSDEEDDFQPNFEFKAQYEGDQGRKLLAMQARFKNDKRFEMDKMFWDDDEVQTRKENQAERNENYDGDCGNQSKDIDEESIVEEKKKELEILSRVLGQNVHVSKLPSQQKNSTMKKMVRYDPTDEKCASLELKREEHVPKKKRRKDLEILTEQKQEEKEQPVVSKEIFYKVTEDLKEVMQEPKEGFSLLGMFGRVEDVKDKYEPEIEAAQELPKTKNKLFFDKSPFKYDSSDSEDDTQALLNEEKSKQKSYENKEIVRGNMTSRLVSDPFFFKGDDWRFDDGVDFIKRIALKGNEDFIKVRQELKSIVRSKVRNNQRKNKQFKKKLGGSAKKKRLRIKKALKR